MKQDQAWSPGLIDTYNSTFVTVREDYPPLHLHFRIPQIHLFPFSFSLNNMSFKTMSYKSNSWTYFISLNCWLEQSYLRGKIILQSGYPYILVSPGIGWFNPVFLVWLLRVLLSFSKVPQWNNKWYDTQILNNMKSWHESCKSS